MNRGLRYSIVAALAGVIVALVQFIPPEPRGLVSMLAGGALQIFNEWMRAR
jgi:hypothetical protein